jgi:hypothetical protein
MTETVTQVGTRGESLVREWSRSELVNAFWLALVPGGIAFAAFLTASFARQGAIGLDAHAYWLAASDPSSWYSRPPGSIDAYLYSPVFAQVLRPFGLLPWPIFQTVWMLAGIGVLAWLLAPLGWIRAVGIGLFFVPELLLGNVFLFVALSLALMVRGFPGAVVFPLLTKIGPAVVALWFVGRRQWKDLARVGVAAVLVVGGSYVFAPEAWRDWVAFLGASADTRGTGALIRVVCAGVAVLWAARRGWAWVLAPAAILASPVLGGLGPFAVLASLPRLLKWQRDKRATDTRSRSAKPDESSRPASPSSDL